MIEVGFVNVTDGYCCEWSRLGTCYGRLMLTMIKVGDLELEVVVSG